MIPSGLLACKPIIFIKKIFGIKCLVKGSRSKEIKAKKRQKNKNYLENL